MHDLTFKLFLTSWVSLCATICCLIHTGNIKEAVMAVWCILLLNNDTYMSLLIEMEL